MQPYYEMKFKCFVLRMAAGSAVMILAVSIIIAIIQEMMGSYDAGSRVAYGLGLAIAGLMVVYGFYLMYQAFHFEKFVFGTKSKDYAMLKVDMAVQAVSAGDLVVTEHFALLFAMDFWNMCTVIRMEDIIGCFENLVYGADGKLKDCTLYIYDRQFKKYTIDFNAKNAQVGHGAKEKICLALPWVYDTDLDGFMDHMLTKAGRRMIMNRIEKERYKVQSTIDIEEEAEEELQQLATEAKQELNFHSILGKVRKTKE